MMNRNNISETQKFANVVANDKYDEVDAGAVLLQVHDALKEKGYNPVNQIVGYILSGDPTYITGHKNARNMIGKLERDELLEEIVNYYLHNNQ